MFSVSERDTKVRFTYRNYPNENFYYGFFDDEWGYNSVREYVWSIDSSYLGVDSRGYGVRREVVDGFAELRGNVYYLTDSDSLVFTVHEPGTYYYYIRNTFRGTHTLEKSVPTCNIEAGDTRVYEQHYIGTLSKQVSVPLVSLERADNTVVSCVEGTSLDLSSVVVNARFEDGHIIENVNYSYESQVLNLGDTYVTVSYEDDGVKTLDIPVTVLPRTPVSVDATDTIKEFQRGILFQGTVKVIFDNNKMENRSIECDWSVVPK